MKEHNEPTNASSLQSDPREERIYRRLVIVGQGPASFFQDACRLMSKTDEFETQTHLVAHCIREIESALRDVLRAVVEVDETNKKQRHRAEISAILTALGIPADDPVSSAWLDLVDREEYGLHKLAHRDSLRAPRRIDKTFEEFWSGMVSVLDAITAKIENRFLIWLPKLDALAKKEHPSQADATFVRNNVPGNSVTLGHFFDQLQAHQWIGPLRNEGFFDHPPSAERDGDYTRFPSWPESRYLARVASLAPKEVLDVALAIPETGNVRVFEDFLDAALAMPPEIAAAIVPKAKEWATSPYHLALPHKLGDLISHLAQGGQSEAALDLAAVVLEVTPDPRFADAAAADPEEIIISVPEPKGRFSQWDYGRVLEHIPDLVEAAETVALDLLVQLLDTAIDLSIRDVDGDKRDLSYVWRPAIEDHEQNMSHGVKDLLVDAVRDAAVSIASRGEATLREVIQTLEGQRFSTFRRIALHLLRVVSEPPRDLLTERIANPDLVDETSVHHEFWLLARDCISNLEEHDRDRFFQAIDSGPDRTELRAGLERWNGEPPSDNDVEKYVNDWKLRRLSMMEATLPAHLRETLDGLRQELGAPEHPEFLSHMGELKTGPNSPVDDEHLRGLDITQLVGFLKEWEPSGEWMGPSPEGLGGQLSAIVAEDPEKFARDAGRFKGLDPTYVRGLISGFEQAHKESRPFPWESVLDLCQWVVKQPREIPDRRDTYSDLDPGWVWTRRAIVGLLSEGFGTGANEIPFELREAAWSVLHPVTDDPDPTPEHEAQYGGDNMDPPTLSINTTRGEAMHAVVRYGLWVHRHLASDAGDENAPSLNEIPEVRQVLDKHLDPESDPSQAIRSVYGQRFPWIILVDRAWAENNATKVFPQDESLRELRDAAWDAYIWRCQPYDSSFEVLGDEYKRAIDRIGEREKSDRDRMNPDEHLAEHIMTYYWQGKLPLEDPSNLLGLFYAKAPPSLRAHALEFVGRAMRNSGGEVLDRILDRVMKLWEWRLDEASKSGNADEDRKELAAFGGWFASESFEEGWALAQLEHALSLGGEIEADHLVAERLVVLSKKFPREAMLCMRHMVESDKEGWGIIGWREEARGAISGALASGDAAARSAAEDLVNYLGTRGHLEFRDLLSEPED